MKLEVDFSGQLWPSIRHRPSHHYSFSRNIVYREELTLFLFGHLLVRVDQLPLGCIEAIEREDHSHFGAQF